MARREKECKGKFRCGTDELPREGVFFSEGPYNVSNSHRGSQTCIGQHPSPGHLHCQSDRASALMSGRSKGPCVGPPRKQGDKVCGRQAGVGAWYVGRADIEGDFCGYLDCIRASKGEQTLKFHYPDDEDGDGDEGGDDTNDALIEIHQIVNVRHAVVEKLGKVRARNPIATDNIEYAVRGKYATVRGRNVDTEGYELTTRWCTLNSMLDDLGETEVSPALDNFEKEQIKNRKRRVREWQANQESS